MLARVLERFAFAKAKPYRDWPTIEVPLARHRDFFEALKADFEPFNLLADVTAIDWEEQSPRFSMLYHFYSTMHHFYLRVVVDLADDEKPTVPTVSDLWPTANWHEREVYDMFGITFEGHPDLKRILMWEGYPYYPLRKDFPLAGKEVALPGADVAEVTGAKVLPAPMMGGPFVASGCGTMSQVEPRAKDQSWTEKSPKSGGEG